MTIFVFAEDYPMFDRASGALRFFSLLKILAAKYRVLFYAADLDAQEEHFGAGETCRYRDRLSALGVEMVEGDWMQRLRSDAVDVVLFEFYHMAEAHLDGVRLAQPGARIVIDTVDVHFKRLASKAQLTREPEDFALAESLKARELAAYRKADFILAVSEPDRQALLSEDAGFHIGVVPNIHQIDAEPARASSGARDLIFVGGFDHQPNVDAMTYFCRDILPLIRRHFPDVGLKIVGSSPPEAVRRLAGERVQVTGYVPDTRPYLQQSLVSVAPLRFGAGLKGKIGEAMACGLPVLSTSIGIEGFDLSPGKNVLVADTPEEFCRAAVRLLRDKELRLTIGGNGRRFIEENYSEAAVAPRLCSVFETLKILPAKKLPARAVLKERARSALERHVLWRFNR
jgi:glycosyltransferase involved in cell wall biosynthesis